MLSRYLWIVFFLLIFQGRLFAHSGSPSYHVIIDTDGAIDDMRAISMFLAGNDVRVLAITCSQGTLTPYSSASKVKSLLSSLYNEGIPVGIGRSVSTSLPVWNGFAESINWGTATSVVPDRFPDASELLNQTLEHYNNKVILVALGSLTTYADWLIKNPAYQDKINRILWYNNPDITSGFNYKVDTVSFNIIKKLGIPLQIISNNREDLVVDTAYFNWIKGINSIYTRLIYQVHQQATVLEKIKQKHLQMWDDLVPLYLTAPMLFTTTEEKNITSVTIDKVIPAGFIYETTALLLASGTMPNNRVFISFPVDTALYKPSIAGILPVTLEMYGEVEWKVIALTNEIHGHTGIYSIIGAKMGVRACEYFNVGVNNLYVTTFTGNEPPLSCLNDGLQVSTGATIGQGLITVSDTVYSIPTVIFEFNGRKIKIRLKESIARQIQEEIEYGVKNYGMSAQYWEYIDELAVKCWSNFDRHDIFIIEKL